MAEYIEKEAAIAVIEEKQKELCPVGMYSRHAVYGSDREKFDAWEEIIEALEAVPSADVAPVRHGRWKPGDMPTYGGFKCSLCKKNTVVYKPNYCPNCGALMDKEE